MKGFRLALNLAAAAVVVLAAVGIAGAVMLNRDNGNTAAPPPQTSATPTPTPTSCRQPDKVSVTFDADADMERAASRLAGDPRFASMTTETKAQAYARAKVVFKDKPDLLDVLTPDAMSAAIRIQPAPSLTAETLADQLRSELPLADGVKLEHQPC